MTKINGIAGSAITVQIEHDAPYEKQAAQLRELVAALISTGGFHVDRGIVLEELFVKMLRDAHMRGMIEKKPSTQLIRPDALKLGKSISSIGGDDE